MEIRPLPDDLGQGKDHVSAPRIDLASELMDQLDGQADDVSIVEAIRAVALTPALSQREREVLREWLLSDSKYDVAQKLYLSMGTVNTHLLRIRAKYELAGRAASTKATLLVRALQDGIIDLDEL